MKQTDIATAADTYTSQLEAAKEIRRLLHDINNSLEIIIQASYLVGTLPMSDDGKQWLKLLDQGVNQAATLNRELREVIRKNTETILNG